MAIGYSNLFELLGRYTKRIYDYSQWIGEIATDKDELRPFHEDFGALESVDLVESTFEGIQDAVTAAIYTLKPEVTAILNDVDLVLNALAVPPFPSEEQLIRAFLDQMTQDDKKVTVGTGQVNSTNFTNGIVVGTATIIKNASAGKMLVGNRLDGYNAPRAGYLVVPSYAIYDISELPTCNGDVSALLRDGEIVSLVCTADSESGGRTEGAELWSVQSNKDGLHFSKEGLGGGTGSPIQTANGLTLLTNGDMESWGGGGPSNWTVAAGVISTDFEQHTSTPFRGSSSIRFKSGSTVNSKLTQSVSRSSVNRLRRYILHCWVRASGATNDDIIIRVKDGSTVLATKTHDPSGTSWEQAYVAFNIPHQLTNDLTIEVEADPNGASLDVNLDVDDVIFFPVSYFAGLHWTPIAGAQKYLSGDRFDGTIALSGTGVTNYLQFMFQAFYKAQFPTSGSNEVGYMANGYFPIVIDGVTVQSSGVLMLAGEAIDLVAVAGGDADGALGNFPETVSITFGAGAAACDYDEGSEILSISVTQASGVATITDIISAINLSDDFDATLRSGYSGATTVATGNDAKALFATPNLSGGSF